MSSDSDLTNFLSRHNITVLNNRGIRRNVIRKLDFFTDPHNYNTISTTPDYTYDRVYVIEISETDLKTMQQFEDSVFKFTSGKNITHFELFMVLMNQKEEEARLRQAFPALQKAFERYSTLLNFCKSKD